MKEKQVYIKQNNETHVSEIKYLKKDLKRKYLNKLEKKKIT